MLYVVLHLQDRKHLDLLFYNHSTRAQQELFTPNAHLLNAVKNASVQCDTSVGGGGTSWSIVIVLDPSLLLLLDFPIMCR